MFLEVGGRHGQLRLAERVANGLRQPLVTDEGRLGLPLLGQRRGDLLLHLLVAGEKLLEPPPDRQRLLELLTALIHPAQRLEDVEEVVPPGLALERPLVGRGGLLGPPDQHQRLAQVERRQRVVGPGRLGLPQGLDRRGVLAPLRLEQPEDHPAHPVLRVARHPFLEPLRKGVQRAPLDVVAVHPIQRRPSSRVPLEQGEEPLHRLPIALVLRRGRVCARPRGG